MSRPGIYSEECESSPRFPIMQTSVTRRKLCNPDYLRAYGVESPFAVSAKTVVHYSTGIKFRRLCSKEKLKQLIKLPVKIQWMNLAIPNI
jgi:hypothetical protein